MIGSPSESPRPTWEEFSQHLASSAPVALRLRGEPKVLLFVEPAGARIGFRIPGAWPDPVATTFAAIRVDAVTLEGGEHTEVSTREQSLYRYFFGFALSIADAVQSEGLPPDKALPRAISQWRALFNQSPLLTAERQLGLLGELWLLNRFLDTRGADALDAWIGPLGEAHDFRIEDVEIEVKATSGEHRSHIISSDSQLVPSPRCKLYLLSLQFTHAGALGRSLGVVIDELRGRLHPLDLTGRFERILEQSFGISDHDPQYYSDRVKLRAAPYLVSIDANFPRITRTDVLSLPHTDMTRVSDVRYRVDVEGLGSEDGTREFLAVIPEGDV